MDPVSLVTGAAILIAGVLIGRVGRRTARRQGSDPQPICGCTHHRALHEPDTGRCRGENRQGNWLDGWRHVKCTCQRYSGPVPIETLWTPPIAEAPWQGDDR
jgi:hypothetical protein